MSAGSTDQPNDIPYISTLNTGSGSSITMSSVDQDQDVISLDITTDREVKRAKWRKYKYNQRMKLRRSGDFDQHERLHKADRDRAAIRRSSLSEDGKKAVSKRIAAYRAEKRKVESRNQRFFRLFRDHLLRQEHKLTDLLPDECVAIIHSNYDRSIGKYGKTPPSFPSEDCMDRESVIGDVKFALGKVQKLIDRVYSPSEYGVTKSCTDVFREKYIDFPYQFFEMLEKCTKSQV